MSLKTYEAIYFILDYEEGLFLLSEVKLFLTINITNAFSFDYYDRTLFIMAKNSLKQNYGTEIFINIDFSGFRVNK